MPFRNYEGSYEGVGEFAGFDFKQSYEQSTFLRIGGGLELRRFGNSGFEVGIGGHVDFGSVDRGEIEISQNGTVVDTGTPEGVLNLADPQLELFVTMGYRLQL